MIKHIPENWKVNDILDVPGHVENCITLENSQIYICGNNEELKEITALITVAPELIRLLMETDTVLDGACTFGLLDHDRDDINKTHEKIKAAVLKFNNLKDQINENNYSGIEDDY